MDRDRVNEISQQIVDDLVAEGMIASGQEAETQWEEEQEDTAYNIIVEKLCKALGIDYDD